MGLTWNLDGLYSSFEDEKFKNDLQTLISKAEGTTETITKLLASDKSDVEIIETYLKENETMRSLIAPVASFSSLSFSTDSTNASALNSFQKIQSLNALLIPGQVMFAKWLVTKDLDKMLSQSDLIQTYEFYLKNILKNEKYALDEKTESIIERMRQTGSRSFDTLQKKISSGMTEEVEIDGKTEVMPLQAIRNLAFEKDPDKRLAGYHAEMKVYKKNEEVSATALNGIKGESLTLNELRGYDSPLEKTLINSYMNRETLDAMLDAMKDALPKFRAYYKKKAELLGHKNGLPFYDIFAPMGSSDITFPYEKGKALVLEQFATFSEELRDFAQTAFDNDWIDVEPRKGKSGGAFCAGLFSLKESRILLNYTGKLNNAITLAHELGHGFHNYNLYNEAPLNIGSPMPLAETASIFCETIVKNAALKDADPESKFSILEVAIQGYSQVIVDIYSRFLFESKVFEARKGGPLSPDQIKTFMLEAQEESYGDGLDPEFRHPYMWMCKTHYYIPDLDFYNFPYAFGLLFAKGIYAKYKEMGQSFVPKLNTLLRSTGKMNVVDVAKQMDIDVTDKSFWQTSLNEICAEIDEFIELSK
ncbi:M3 family oligoendopeptidase [Acidaminobacter sp. JC074]|uniref:M3 family oligoendopeptidase n=1 Tax=Acidaminobacter sp. JC074 TaxID=2530199 RepID=UPI001F0E8C27|nr:M3 family oligoendopeptidase [Acidaminobacter sp. JC074]MCH4887329.1 M3 family oligoendopeptidase [Acidaminobacter sp. JC074]